MVKLHFDSPNPLDVFNNPNCKFIDGIGMRLEAGDPGYVVWFPPGYTPPKPEAKKQPRRHSTLSPVTPNPATTMPSFQYTILPNPKNPERPFRGRAKPNAQVTQED